MNNLSMLYHRIDDITSLINNDVLNPQKEYLVRIYTANCESNEAVEIAREIKSLFPRCSIIGATTVGLMFKDVFYEEETMVIFEHFEHAQCAVQSFYHEAVSTKELAGKMASFANDFSARLMHVMFSREFTSAHGLVEEFNRLNNTTLLVGGAAGDIFYKGINSYVFDDEGVKSDCIMCAAISGKDVHVKSWVNIPHEPISEVFTITKTQGSAIKTIDDKDAKEWIAEYLGVQNLYQYPDYRTSAEKDELAHFPFVLEGHSGASRLLYYDSSRDAVCQYFSEVPEGTRFRIGYASPKSVATNTYSICRDLPFQPVESIFHYSCFFRKLYFDNCTEWEMSPYRGNGLCGVFLNGEIGNTGESNECLCGSSVLVSVAENETFIRPDMECFKTINAIEDKTQELLNYVLIKQKNILSENNKKLLYKLTLHQDYLKSGLYYDSIMGLPNSLKYREDLKNKKFDKICILSVENSLSLITHVNHEGYYAVINSALSALKSYLQTTDIGEILDLYCINEGVFMLAACSDIGEAAFKKVAEELFNRFHFFTVNDRNVVVVSRFVLVFNQADLMEAAFIALRDSQYEQVPFLVVNDIVSRGPIADDEFETLSILNNALAYDGVVPYFQGIYNNELHCIDRYEALMRIKDVDGTIYLPSRFLAIAKKYHLYTYLSMRMINAVLDRFKNRKEIISLNISAFDIDSPMVRNLIFEKLQKTEDCSRIIFEIVENEYLSNLGIVKDFIGKIHDFGAKIAIDDFGSGYSNLREIIAIRPDYIKIYGDIVKNISTDIVNNIMIETVFSLANRLQTELIAEFVENEKIQYHVEKYRINYSQGFLFSMPAPFEQVFH